ncbi:MAG: hypothetical protein JSV33_07545 [bacterium]|nr:MAG: hypothetical protein JSV33_07545 [bacterium]
MKCYIYISGIIIYLVLALFTSGCSDDSTGPDGESPFHELNHLWSKHYGDANDQRVYGVACDGSGNVVVTGCFMGTVNFGGSDLTSAGDWDIFLAKFDADGGHLWSKRFGNSDNQIGASVACGESGNVAITGYYEGDMSFGGGGMHGYYGGWDIFVAQFDADGGYLWSKAYGDEEISQYGHGVVFDGSGNVIFTGEFEGTLYFGVEGGFLTSSGSSDILIVKLDPDGGIIWRKRFGDSDYQCSVSIASDGMGNMAITGTFHGTVDFGGGALINAGCEDIFLAMFDPNGSHLWSKSFGDVSDQRVSSIACDESGKVAVTGDFEGSVDFGGGPLASAGNSDIFLAQFDEYGSHLWSKRFGDVSFQQCQSVTCDGSGNVVVTGDFMGNVDFGGSPLTSPVRRDIFLAMFDMNGDHIWSKRFGDDEQQYARGVTFDESGNVVVTGIFFGAVYFGGEWLTSAGGQDIFLAKFGPQ